MTSVISILFSYLNLNQSRNGMPEGVGRGGGEPMACVEGVNPLVVKNDTRAKTLVSELIGINSMSNSVASPLGACLKPSIHRSGYSLRATTAAGVFQVNCYPLSIELPLPTIYLHM